MKIKILEKLFRGLIHDKRNNADLFVTDRLTNSLTPQVVSDCIFSGPNNSQPTSKFVSGYKYFPDEDRGVLNVVLSTHIEHGNVT